MTLRVDRKKFCFCADVLGRSLWSYQSEGHFLDVMIKPGCFARVADQLSVGDIILVDSPGYIGMEHFLGAGPQPVRRVGGGVLQIDAKADPNLIGVRIVGRGLRRFVKAGEDAMSGVFEIETDSGPDDSALSA